MKILVNVLYRYVRLNVSFSNTSQQYDDDIPTFLQNRPRQFVDHVRDRWAVAQASTKADIQQVDANTFRVNSFSSDRKYSVSFVPSGMPSCECDDWDRYHWPCKHFCVVFQNTAHGWNDLSQCYRESPYFAIDDDVLTQIGSITFTSSSIGNERNVNEDVADGSENVNSTNLEPVVDTSFSTESYAAQCRESARQIIDLTYLCDDSEALKLMIKALNEAKGQLKLSLPNDDGLL